MKMNKKHLIVATLLLLLSCAFSVNGYTVYTAESDETEDNILAKDAYGKLEWVIRNEGWFSGLTELNLSG